ncbi:MAG TPA: DUF4861 domain-containing protein [Petrimonas sp.]|uniref:DUF4861 family protein n=1 Tax=Petrimonas sp. TaxID=2023866 RepID=UPI001774323C|nr:DUF4861 domain-containing protein [Petrimonas sp.]
MTLQLLNRNRLRSGLAFLWMIPACCLYTTTVHAQDAEKMAKQKAFEEVFGDAVRLDPAMVEKVKNDTPGKRHHVDKDGDGKPEEVWFIDIEPRHTDAKRPILVKVVDENGNLEIGKEPEKYGDLWIADWHADGLVDAVISYRDLDGDRDLDVMEWFTYGKKNWRVQMDGLRALVSTDNGDDNLLDYDMDYVYYQIPCQNHSHFGGNESFTAYYLDPGQNRWIPYFENPFLFYDSDNDGISEEVIRVEGKEELVKSLRWSFNVNPIAGRQRDFDVSISACARGWTQEKDRESDFAMYLPEDRTEHFMIRGIPTGPVLKRSCAREFLQTITWERVLMTWNENNLNIAFNDPKDTIERWEGVINAASADSGYCMPRIGAPDCGPYNKRYELVLQPKGPDEYYYNPADHRIHVKNSDRTRIKVDYDYDTQTDMGYSWVDTDKDGIMDRVDIDTDGDGITDDSYPIDVSEVKPVDWTFNELNGALAPVLETEPEHEYYLVKALFSALESIGKGTVEDSPWDMVENRMRNKNITDGIAHRLINSDQTLMYYLMLVQDRRIAQLKKSGYKNNSFWREFNTARSKGDTRAMTQTVAKYFKTGKPEEDYRTWTGRLRKEEERPHVAWNNQWLPPNWGWESEKAAFRFYLGHFDLFGKRQWIDTLVMPRIAEGKSYHLDQNGWGMDILHVGKTAGCGGLILYVNGVPYPVRNETGKGNPTFTGRLVEETHHKVTLEFIAEGVGPENAPYAVRLRPSIGAGDLYSSVEATVDGGTPGDKIELGIGLVRLPDETFFSDKASGVIGSWGFQDPEIGWIGMGIMFPPARFLRFDDQPEEHRVVLDCTQGKSITYCIQGDWLRGHQFSCCPSAQDWFNTLKYEAGMIKKK